jgi:aspartyl/asparaginyl beta-hydroxylase (cupin superfamily)
MTFEAVSASADVHAEAANRAMRLGDLRTALERFKKALSVAPGRLDMWMGLAACHRALNEPQEALAALEKALGIEPRLFPALLMKGSLFEALGQDREADSAYDAALKLAPPESSLPEPTRRALARAREFHDRRAGELSAFLRAEVDLGAAPRSVSRRAEAFIEAAAGRRRIYHQEPVVFHYPGLPAIEFYDREEFPFLKALEARTEAIRAEALAVWAEGSPRLTPYIQYPESAPVDQWSELNHSLRWSAFHLIKDGKVVEANAALCPQSLDAVGLIDQPHVQDRSPVAMFSILRPNTRIPPHTGVSNTRLVLHLPLVVPENCGFRVGGETRPWREGEAFVFDDTIEHEAWNDSDKPRAVLICDVWSPRLSGEERELVARLTAAIDRFNGFAETEANL